MKRFLFVVISFSAFASQAAAQTLLEDGKIPKDLVIKLERIGCFGTCPDYVLTIRSNGVVKFKGRRFTTTKGEANGKINDFQIKQLINEFEEADFFALQNIYSCIVDDSPLEIISIKLKGKTKKVTHYFGCEAKGDALERIENLGKKIDKITNSKRWIGK